MGSIIKQRSMLGETYYTRGDNPFVAGHVNKVGGFYTVTLSAADGTITKYSGYCSLANAERLAEQLLGEMGYTIFAPIDVSTPAPEPAPVTESGTNSIEVVVTGLEVGSDLQIKAQSVIDRSEPCDWPGVKRAARLGRATLTFHNDRGNNEHR